MEFMSEVSKWEVKELPSDGFCDMSGREMLQHCLALKANRKVQVLSAAKVPTVPPLLNFFHIQNVVIEMFSDSSNVSSGKKSNSVKFYTDGNVSVKFGYK